MYSRMVSSAFGVTRCFELMKGRHLYLHEWHVEYIGNTSHLLSRSRAHALVVYHTSGVDTVLHGAHPRLWLGHMVPRGLPVEGYGGHGDCRFGRLLCVLFRETGTF